MSDDLSKVDWTRPIEAVHEDGRVCEARSIYGPFGPEDRQAHCILIGTMSCDVFDDGSVRGGSSWRIRNVAEPDIGIPMTDDIAKRMEAFIRFVAGQDVDTLPERSITRVWAYDARAIVALLPEPVDADLVEAREICLRQAIDEGCDEADMHHHYSKATVEGNASVRLAVTCIRRGRALERDSMEG